MTIFLSGAFGQLGQELALLLSTCPYKLILGSHTDTNIVNYNQLKARFSTIKLDYIINCAAYTNVELAETEPLVCWQTNSIGAANLAVLAKDHQAVLIQISSDYVFDGLKRTPYTETDAPNPLGVYGASKFSAEQQVLRLWPQTFVLRTAWLYGHHGQNFLHKIERAFLACTEVAVVADQQGSPTACATVAGIIAALIATQNQHYGLYHVADSGAVSWYNFAKAYYELQKNKKNYRVKTIKAVRSADQQGVKRPLYSVLDSHKIARYYPNLLISWQSRLAQFCR